MEVNELLEKVTDSKSFLVFAHALAADRTSSVDKEKSNPSSAYNPEANGWENTTIESFLNAAISWAEDSKFGLNQGMSEDNPWRQFAVFLYCGKSYE